MLKRWSWLASLVVFSILLAGCFVVPSDANLAEPTQSIDQLVASQLSTLAATPACPVCPTCPAPATATKTPVPPTPTPTPTKTKTAAPTVTPVPMAWELQSGSPATLQNYAHLSAGCNWIGVAGQAFGKDTKPVKNLVVVIGGSYNNSIVDKVGLTGMSAAQAYGPGGYEIVLGNKAVVSDNTLKIQLFDLAGKALTAPIPFSTKADCKANLILINFREK